MKTPILLSTISLCIFADAGQAAQQPVSLSGEYDYKNGAHESTLYVKELPGAKIQFAMHSLWIGNVSTGNVHTGQASGVAPVKKNVAVFEKKEDHLKLTFTFLAGKCKVECPDESTNYYGGMNVDPNGTYDKVSSKIPSPKELTVE